MGFVFYQDGQSQTPISLKEAISISRQSNRSIRKANQSIAVRKATYEQTKGNFLPYFGVELMDVVTNNPLQVFGFKLLTEETKQEDFNPALLNSPDVTNHFSIGFNGMIPLYNPEAKAEQVAVLNEIKMSESVAQRTVEGVEMQVIKSYYLLLLTQSAVDVFTESYEAAQSNFRVTQNYFDQGLMLKSDLLEMQIMVNQNKLALQSAQLNKRNAQSQFNHVLANEDETEYQPTDELNSEVVLLSSGQKLNHNRADFQAIQYGIQAMESMAKAADKSFIPKVNAFAKLGLHNEVPYGIGANNFLVGVTVSWDIFKGNSRNTTINKTRAEIQETRLELEEQMASAQLEITQVSREIVDIISQIELHELSIVQAQEALRIRKNRFERGLEKNTDIINSENQLSQRKLARLQSLFALNVKQAYLNYLLN